MTPITTPQTLIPLEAAPRAADPIDFLPAVNSWDSCRAAHAAPRGFLLRWQQQDRGPWLTSPPGGYRLRKPCGDRDALHKMFLAALTSLSCVVVHRGQVHDLTSSGFGPSPCPHVEHSCDDGNQRPIFTTRRPRCAAFFFIRAISVDQPASTGPAPRKNTGRSPISWPAS